MISIFGSVPHSFLGSSSSPENSSKEPPFGGPFARNSVLLNWELPPWRASFRSNLAALLARKSPLNLTSRPGRFWPDVFVDQSLAWKNLSRSYVYHALAIGIIYMASLPFYLHRAEIVSPFENTTITYYKPSEYVPPIEIRTARARVARKGEVRQQQDTVLSVSHRADNAEQTIVNPEPPKVATNAALPNLVAFRPTPPPPPVGTVAQSKPKLALPEILAIAPPPDLTQQHAKLTLPTFEPTVIPPSPENAVRKLSELKMATIDNAPVNAAPKAPATPLNMAKNAIPAVPEAIAPPPDVSLTTNSKSALIALNLNPAPGAPPETLKVNNRRGMFGTGPNGKPGGSGEPEVKAGSEGPGGESFRPLPDDLGLKAVLNSSPAGRGVTLGVPTNAGGKPSPVLKQAMIAAMNPRADIPATISRTTPAVPASGNDRTANQVFRGRKYYTMALNSPNLNSAGGSWIFRFAELTAAPKQNGELTAPVALEKVDPAYPADLIHDRVEGVVILHAVIRADGNVGDVQVLEGFDDRLDENARLALLRWHFIPGTKNGNPVDLEAVVRIPFRAHQAF
jgi:TonB family protein